MEIQKCPSNVDLRRPRRRIGFDAMQLCCFSILHGLINLLVILSPSSWLERTTLHLGIHSKGSILPVSECPPSTLAARVCCVTATDKLLKWSVLGVQGALLNQFMEPLYMTSIVTGKVGYIHTKAYSAGLWGHLCLFHSEYRGHRTADRRFHPGC